MFDKENIINLLKEGFSLSEICKKFNWSYHKVYYWCKNNNIELSRKRNGKSYSTLQKRKERIVIKEEDKDQLKNLYINKNWSVHKIADFYKTTGATIASSLRRFGIPVKLQNGKFEKRKPTRSKEVLHNLYIKDKLSMQEIAEVLGYRHHGEVYEDLKFYKIATRNYKEAGKELYKKHPEKRDLHRRQFYEGITGPTHGKITSLEQRFMDWANNIGISFCYQFQIPRYLHRYDFLIEYTNIIVEMDGDFWHSLPEHILRDKNFDNIANKCGYLVVRIKDFELDKNPNIFNEKILPLIGGV